MAHRKEVFQSKVLQRLYPAAPKVVKSPSSPSSIVEGLAKKICVKRNACQGSTAIGDTGTIQSGVSPFKRMYTVLPPPENYKTELLKSVSKTQLETTDSDKDPGGKGVHESDEELDHDKEEETRKRRRRRKRVSNPHQCCGKDTAAPESGPSAGRSGTPADERGERISMNKKRKLKKKRHKERLLAMGLMPRTAALEFTYKKDVEREDGNKRQAAEVSDFLRTTMKSYISDCSMRVDKLHPLSEMLDGLLGSIASGCKPISVVKQLHSLKGFVLRKEADELEKALRELDSTSSLSAGEITAVVSLFQYWITDILPKHGNKKTELSTTHPRDCLSH